MEKDFNSWFQHRCLDVQSPVLNSSGARVDTQLQNNFSAFMIPCYNGVSTNGNFPLSSYTAPLQFRANQPNEPRFYGLPNFHQGSNPLLKSVTKEKDPAGSVQNLGWIGNPAERKFLVFDQSGDQTRLLYSSANDAPATGVLPWLQKPPSMAYNSTKGQLGSRINKASPLGRFLGDECIEDNLRGGVEESEMREDTEELNALLYSDDDDDDDDDDDGEYSEDDEEISTGHSPSTMTAHNKHEWLDERIEEVGSSDEPSKRLKLIDGSYGVPCPLDNATPAKPFGCSELEDDAESSCGNIDEDYQVSGVSGRKRSRKEKIRETLSLLQKIIPGGRKGKDAMDVIDGTIRYLKSLKVEAKSLRLDAL
ncbi:PREDICTED: transcription factor bHLH143-like [Ipomoea nil]|uniref:transcription factor bHLH143-like n=1 Tax=Ipomoea nil TaxID=35883 RepID=UPI000900D8F1|nr:PREDICTED: transcription factor bHLH143-like [Ipomoea nil]